MFRAASWSQPILCCCSVCVRYYRVVAFLPTGWTYVIAKEAKKRTASTKGAADSVLHHKETKGSVTVYTVPYSEHSSFAELRDFVAWTRPARIVPTVLGGGRQANREKQYAKICAHFDDLIDRKAASRHFIATMFSGPASSPPGAVHCPLSSSSESDNAFAPKRSKMALQTPQTQAQP